jgi:TonB family protein
MKHARLIAALLTAVVGIGRPRPALAQAAGVQTVTVSPPRVTIRLGTATDLRATIVADAAITIREVTWSSSDTTVASVDAHGRMFARALGTANIVATAVADPRVHGTASVVVAQSDLSGPAPPFPPGAERVYYEFQVEKPVGIVAAATPHYPDSLRARNIEGMVFLQFVVDTTGRADTTTVKVLRSTDSLFTNAVRAVLPNMRFSPATIRSLKVRQLVQQPFQFTLSRSSPPPPPRPP